MKNKKDKNWVNLDEDPTVMGITCDVCGKREEVSFPPTDKELAEFEGRHTECSKKSK